MKTVMPAPDGGSGLGLFSSVLFILRLFGLKEKTGSILLGMGGAISESQTILLKEPCLK